MEYFKVLGAKSYFKEYLPENLFSKYSEAKVMLIGDFHEDCGEILEWSLSKTKANSDFVAEAFDMKRFTNSKTKDGRWTIEGKRFAIYAKEGLPKKEMIKEVSSMLRSRNETTN